MENIKYIPGDLVMNRKHTVLKIEDMVAGMLYTKYQDDRPGLYISYKDVLPIPLTPQILEANGWDLSIIKNRNYWSKVSSDEELLRFKSIDASIQRIAVKDKIALIYFSSNPNVFFFELSHMVIRIKYTHQLQHLLFGLGFDSSLKV